MSIRHHSLAVLGLAMWFAGCSSKAKTTPDAAPDVSKPVVDAKLPVDAKVTLPKDAALPKDTALPRDTALPKDTAAKEVAIAPGDAAGEAGTPGDSSVDVSGTVRDGGQDVAQDTAPMGLGTCASPIDLPTDVASVDITVDTTGAAHVVDFPCVENGSTLVFRIKVDIKRKLYYAHTFGAAWNTALFFSDSCTTAKMPAGEDATACNDDACATTQSAARSILTYGYRYLFVSGVGGASGSVKVHFEQANVGGGALIPLPEGSGAVQGTLTGSDTIAWCEASGTKNNYYWVSCPEYPGGALSATTCAGPAIDTVLSVQAPRGQMQLCMDDDLDCGGGRSTIATPIPGGAGLNLVTVAGGLSSSVGAFTLTYTRP